MSSSRNLHYPGEEEDDDVPIQMLFKGSSSSSEISTPEAAKDYEAEEYADRFKVPPEYGLRKPEPDQRAHNPPAGYAAIYTENFKSGLSLPLPPFVVAVLRHYKIALVQLHPNSVYTVLGFVKKCEDLSVVPTIGLFRHYYKLWKCQHGEGWYNFNAKAHCKIAQGQSLRTSDWKKYFLFFKTAPMSENLMSFGWNHSPNTKPPLGEDEEPSVQAIDMLKAIASKRKSAVSEGSAEIESKDADENDNPRQKMMKSFSITNLEGMSPQQFGTCMQKCMSSFQIKLQGDKEQLEKIVADKDKEIAILQAELQKVVQDKEEEIVALKAQLNNVVKDRGPLLRAYTRKLLKTKGFARFFLDLTTLARKFGYHKAVKKMQRRSSAIPKEAIVGLEDPLAGYRMDKLFYDMIQDDGYKFPVLEYLLSLEEIPSSSELKDLKEDEDVEVFRLPRPSVSA